MNSIDYEIQSDLPFDRLLVPLADAEDRLARLDERVRASPLRTGWQARLLYREACACRLAAGELVHLEDLVLFDGGAFSGAPSPDLSAAWQTLRVLRAAARGDADRLLALPRPGEDADPIDLGGSAQAENDVPDFFYDRDRNDQARLAEWRAVLRQTQSMPPLLASALAWDAWIELEPEQRGAWRAPLIAALVLKARGKTKHYLLPLDTGQRFAKYRRHPRHKQADRLAGFLEWALVAADTAAKDLAKLTLAEELLRDRLKGRRSSSRLPGLVDLLLSRPMVSIPMAARELKVSPQAVTAMLGELGSVPRELTGRGRYRTWGIV